MFAHTFRLCVLVTPILLASCATRPATVQGNNTCDLAAPDCGESLVCNAVVTGDARCVAPVVVSGEVLNSTDDAPIEGALVQAVDVNGAALGPSAISNADGRYSLSVPVLREEDGTPLEGLFTLRSQAATYEAFPSVIRPALPIDSSSATATTADGWRIETALTTIKLIPLPGDTSELGSIMGTISATRISGILVVAEMNNKGFVGFSDSNGAFVIFNVPAGTYTVRGYTAGVQLAPTVTTILSGEHKTDIDLSESADPLSTVSGSVEIVDAVGGSVTSVILAVESTFAEDAARGEVPPGLRVGDVSSTFIIDNVPNGRYIVLAAFENDGLVRDPDDTIAGTQIVHFEVPDAVSGNEITISQGFKITGALGVVGLGAEGPELISDPNPIFEWQDDASEDGYVIQVFDAFGNEIWRDEIGSVMGADTVTRTYEGSALETGLFYQFRATSFREPIGKRTEISRTEDLKGVFQFAMP